MPAKSEAQRKLLNAKFGHEWVKRHGYDNKGHLPPHIRKKSKDITGGPKKKKKR